MALARPYEPLRFDAAVLLASLWFVGGLLVDGWAHSNLDLSREGFFTPFHAIFYSGFVAVAAIVIAGTYRSRAAGRRWYATIPAGYTATLAGLGVFAVGGVLDLLWHLAFGIEQDVAALFSPTHLILAVGIALILTGPIRSTLARAPARSFATQWPALVAIGLFGTLVMFFLLWIFSTFLSAGSDPHITFPRVGGAPLEELRQSWQIRGMAAITIRSLVTVALLVWASRRLALPFGASILLVAMPNVLISVMLAPSLLVFGEALAASIVAGVAADAAFARGITFDESGPRSRILGFAIPFLFWATFVVLSLSITHGSWWVIHMIAGAPVFAGLAGALLSIVAERPRVRQMAVTETPVAAIAPSLTPGPVRTPKATRRARKRTKRAN